MGLSRKLGSRLVQLYTSPPRRNASRQLAEWGRRLRRAPHCVQYFHQVDDPYSQLTAQVLEALLERYAIDLRPILVGLPDDKAAPERDQLVGYSRADAAAIAPYYGLEFEDRGLQPSAQGVELANRILAANSEAARFVPLAAEVGRALWSEDLTALEELAKQHAASDVATARRAVELGDKRRAKLGHYLGGTLYYGGEWYWGVDRIPYLEERLCALGLAFESGRVVQRRVHASSAAPGKAAGLVLEYFPSLRSPYTYIAMERTFDLVERYGVELEMRPVLPMVMRGLGVSSAKRLYIVLDTKREAESLGLPFGRVADPVGEPVERGYSLYAYACRHGREKEFMLSFARAAFADGIDTGDDAGLRSVVERAGLDWDEARRELGNEDWRPGFEQNRQAMRSCGLWGVPSYRLRGPEGHPDFPIWGQDRLWLIEERIRERLS